MAYSAPSGSPPLKILILKRDKLGDLLLTTPLIKVLRAAYPDAIIDLLASDYNAWVAEGNPHLNRIMRYTRVRVGHLWAGAAIGSQIGLFLSLRRSRYDFVIVAQGEDSPRAIQRALWTGARRVISYANDDRFGTRLTDRQIVRNEGHEAERLLRLLQPLGIDCALPPEAPLFMLPDSAREFAQQWLAQRQINPGRYVVLGLGARRARKQPSTEQLVRWISYLKTRHAMDTVFMWTPGDKNNPAYPGDDAIADPVLALSPPGLVPFRGPLLPAIGLIWNAATSIFPDSGLMHFASASPGGVLGLFGDEPAFAQKWHPLGRKARYLVDTTVTNMEDATVFAQIDGLLAGK